MKSIAVVANGTPTRDLSKEIDQCDEIIRFNLTYNLPSNLVGEKVTILALQRLSGNDDARFLNGNNNINLQVLEKCREIWFLNLYPNCMVEMINKYQIKDKEIKIIDENMKNIKEIDFYWTKFGWKWNPSSAAILIYWLINEKKYEKYVKKLFGFEWKGSPAHFWSGEKNLMQYWSSIGKIKIIA